MGLKPGRAYTRVSGPAYVRKEYMGGIPGSKITIFDMGNPRRDFPVSLSLVTREAVQIRHNALELSLIHI